VSRTPPMGTMTRMIFLVSLFILLLPVAATGQEQRASSEPTRAEREEFLTNGAGCPPSRLRATAWSRRSHRRRRKGGPYDRPRIFLPAARFRCRVAPNSCR
jgi:hypothetical protein